MRLQTIGRPMRITYLLLFLSLSAFSQVKPRIQVIPNPESAEDFDHQFKGCPENSECDQVSAHMLTRWKGLITKLKEIPDTNKTSQALELFRAKYGIPTEFYTNQKSQIGFKPVLYSSSCKAHNPKIGEKILKGTSFVKSLSETTAILWRDQAQIELPVKENITAQPLRVYYDGSPATYYLPLGDQPLFIKARELYILKEEDGYYYTLKISENGDWKIVNLDMSELSVWESKREEVACPKDTHKAPAIFGTQFCKTIWDVDAKKVIVAKIAMGCPI